MRKLLVGSLTALLLAAVPLAASAANPCTTEGTDLLAALEAPAPAAPTDPGSLPFGGQEPVFVDCIDGCISSFWQCYQYCGSEDWFCKNQCEEGRDRCIMYCSP